MSKIIKKDSVITTQDYVNTLTHIKTQIKDAQIRSILAANKELILFYWNLGKTIVEKQSEHNWGTQFIENLAQDLQNAFPGMSGFSRRNLFRIKAFYLAYQIVPQAVAHIADLPIFHIPWGHNALILEKIKNNNERLWYAQKSIENGWSRNMLEIQIESDLYHRQGKAITNFTKTLPSPHSDMAQQTLKDPYVFDFLTLQEDHVEHDIEQGLINNVQKLLLEMGKGFALVARQYHLEVGEQDYYIDLLFYHTKLKCYIVVELKNTAFVPEYAGKLNFYLSAVDDLVRDANDKPTIGLLLCRTKNNFTAEYALRNISSPIGIAEYQTEILKKLPKELTSSLPSIEEIEAELEKKEYAQKNKNKE